MSLGHIKNTNLQLGKTVKLDIKEDEKETLVESLKTRICFKNLWQKF